ncbi:MAG: hypothetical protein K0R73_1466 [Candidatus Midichloriaceae bacterium]|jgi:hypothetical protein|nr:hypothetical protein [Candidatus Midichloriaceae bacterium]
MEEKDRAELVRGQAISIKAKMDVASNKQAVESCIADLKALLSDPYLPAGVADFIKGLITAAEEKTKTTAAVMQSNVAPPVANKPLADFYISMAKFEQSAKSYADLLEEAKKKEYEFKDLLMNTIEANPKSEAADNARIKFKDNIVGRLSIANGLEAKSKECDEHYEKMQVAKKEVENDKSLSQEQRKELLEQANAELISAQAKLAGLNSQNQALSKQLVADIEKAVLDKVAASKSSSMTEYNKVASQGLSEEQKKEIAIFVKDCQGMPKELIDEKYRILEEKITGMQALKVEELEKIEKPEWAEKVEKDGGEVEKGRGEIEKDKADLLDDLFDTPTKSFTKLLQQERVQGKNTSRSR